MEFIYDYMRDETLRHALNELTRKTFCFDFESWVTDGYSEGDYIPHSFIEDGKILANVSANIMHFMQNGVSKNYIQLGTVMTDEAYRRQGLAGKLIKMVVEKYEKECDGIYLFGNLESLDFYRKMGFAEGLEYRYFVKPEFLPKGKAEKGFTAVDASDAAMKEKYLHAVRNSAVNSSFEQVNKFGLQLFYTGGFDTLYYAEDLDCFVSFEKEEDMLLLNSVICEKVVSLADVLKHLDGGISSIRLGFAPLAEDRKLCDAFVYDGADDYRFFYKGEELKSIENEQLYFPEYSHA